MGKESVAHYIPECDNSSFKCPIGLDLMTDPVVLNGDGYTYERKNIEKHLKFRYTSPMTNKHLKDHFLINNNLKSQIEEWKMNNIKKRKIILKDDLIKYEDELLKIINDEVNIDIESKELINSIFNKLVDTIIDKFDFDFRYEIYDDDSYIPDCIEEDSSDEEYSNHKLIH